MGRWKPVDVLIILLGGTLFLSIFIPMVRSFFTGVPISDTGVEWISKILLAIVAILSMYVGAKVGGRSSKDDDE